MIKYVSLLLFFLNPRYYQSSEHGTTISTKKIRKLMTLWVVEALKKISPNIIKKSFKETGISLALDGSEEHLCKVDINPFDFYRSDRR